MIKTLPNVNFNVRVRDDSIKGDNPFKWEKKSTNDYFANKKVVLFHFQAHSHLHVQLINYQILIDYMMNLKILELMKFIVFL